MRYLVFVVLTIIAVSTAYAATYQWVDSAGVTHFTDDPDRVPAKYRSRARERESVKSEETSNAPAPQTAPVAENPAAPVQRDVYGGHDESWWRSAFRDLRQEQKALQDKLPEKREQLVAIHRRRVIFQKASYREAYNKLDQEIKDDEARIKALQDKLDALDQDATKAGVPKEWR